MADNTVALIIDKHPSGDGTLTIHVDDGEYGTSGDYSIAASIGVVTLYQMGAEAAMSLPDGILFDGITYKDLNLLAIAVRQRVRDLGGDVYWDADNPIITLMEPIQHPKDLAPPPPKQSEQRYALLCQAISQCGITAHISEDDGGGFPMVNPSQLYATVNGVKVEIFTESPFGDTKYIPVIAEAISTSEAISRK